MGRPTHRLPATGDEAPQVLCQLAGAARAAKPPASPERRRPCGRRDTKRSDWRDGRAAASTSRLFAARPRAWRVRGVAIWPAKREALLIRTGLFAKRDRSRAA